MPQLIVRGGDALMLGFEYVDDLGQTNWLTRRVSITGNGFFDVMDRPPMELWLEAIGRRSRSRAEAFEIAILCWIPPALVERARAGRRAVAAGSLAWLAEVSDALWAQANAISRSSAGD